MYIISENENLLERLRLLVLNTQSLQQDENHANGINNDKENEAQALLAKRKDQLGLDSDFILLMAKHWDEIMLETLSDITRMVMAHGKTPAKILIIKKDYDKNDDETLNNIMLDIKQKWCQEWTFQFEKTRNLAESAARKETLKRQDLWTSPDLPEFRVVHFDNTQLAHIITKTFKLNNGLSIKDQLNRRPSLFNKPPALHWSHFPRESELQIMFKFTFPQGALPEPLFRQFAAAAKQSFDWEYDYEWTGGIFLRHDLTKISVYRANNRTVEIAGRIDNDEYQAEIEDDTLAEVPFKQVWPLLARVIKVIETECIEGNTHGRLPYLLSIAFFGSQFFKDINYVDVTGPVTARLLDATQSMGALERTGSIKFGIGKRLVSIDLQQAFPGFQPHCLADFFALSDQPVSTSRASSSPLPTPVTPCTNIVLENHEDDEFPTSSLTHNNSFNNIDRTNSQPGLLSLNIQSKHRGRRVSFGAIRSIPQQNSVERENIFLGRENGRSASDTEDGQTSSTSTPSQASVQDYVDQLLRKTMDEVLVMD